MDEDIVETFGTPEMMNKEEDCNKRGDDSSGKALASKSKEKKIPHYLRASTGSCHDLCKYGKRQIPLEKPWHSTTKKTFKKTLDDDMNETLKPGSSKPKKKVMDVKKKGVSDGSSEVIKREVVKNQASGGASGMKKPEILIIPAGDETPVKQMKKKTVLCSKVKPSPDSGSHSSGNVDAVKPKVFSKSYSALATSKSKVNHEQVVDSPVLRPKLRGKSGVKDKDAEIKKATVPFRVAANKVMATPRASLSPGLRLAGNSNLRKSQSLKTASSSSSRKKQKPKPVIRTDESNRQSDDYPVEEKTLHVVEMETGNNDVSENDQNQQDCIVEPILPPLPPTQPTTKDDDSTISATEEYEYTSGSYEEAESAEEENGISRGEARKEGDSADEAARKLHFRRGKVVDNNTVGESARKLKFRKGRGLEEDKAQDTLVRRSFKKREDIREEEVDENGEKVVLRHQDVQEKDEMGLLNNVIEETASKLVEARKSKVKALVGAFETVMSLQ